MPRNSLRNIGAAAPASIPPTPPPLLDEVQSLLTERQALEARMSALTGGSLAGAESRYPITPLAQRRAGDDAWARRRDDQPSQPSAARAQPDIGRQLRSLTGASANEPELAERTGQRALQERAGRFGDAIPPGLSERLGRFEENTPTALGDRIDRLADSMPPPMRLLDPAPLKNRSIGLRERHLRNDPALRDFAAKIPVPKEPMLREIKDRFTGPAKRLDILTGGSGDLDQLRQTAGKRMKARRDEERREARQTARRKSAKKNVSEDQQREDRRSRKRGKYD